MSDVTFKSDEGRFNFRVAGVIIEQNRLLAMTDEGLSYFYLPGGRVKIHETSLDAIRREIMEELGSEVENSHLLWVNENFFVEEQAQERFHEICFFHRIKISHSFNFGTFSDFTRVEGNRNHLFRWIDVDEIHNHRIVPEFLKDRLTGLGQDLHHIVWGK